MLGGAFELIEIVIKQATTKDGLAMQLTAVATLLAECFQRVSLKTKGNAILHQALTTLREEIKSVANEQRQIVYIGGCIDSVESQLEHKATACLQGAKLREIHH